MQTYLSGLLSLLFLALLATFKFAPVEVSAFSTALFASLCYASYVDLKKMEIPDLIAIGLFPLGALWVLRFLSDQLHSRLMEAIVILVFFTLFNQVFRALRNKDGLGFGDIKLIASATVWIGIANVPVMILLASCSGLIASFYRFDKKGAKIKDTRIPFGPHLAAAIWVTWSSTLLTFLDTRLSGPFS